VNLNGQWIGPYTGTNSGNLVVDLDDVGDYWTGTATVHDNNAANPAVVAELLSVPKGKSNFSLQVPLRPVDRETGNPLDPVALNAKYPGVQLSPYADTIWAVEPSQISVRWVTGIGTSGEGRVSKSEADKPSTLKSLTNVTSWSEFKEYAVKLSPYKFVFRGREQNIWKLRTSFHRTGRSSLIRFMTQDVASLHRYLSGLTAHRFNLTDPLDYAAFLNLAQHHGYPTPLLDWTLRRSSPHTLRTEDCAAVKLRLINEFEFISWTDDNGTPTLKDLLSSVQPFCI
jgi:hypothetical protein